MIGLLMLTHNRLDAVADCLDSLEPTLTARDDVMLFVLDNGSTDGTREYLDHCGIGAGYIKLDHNVGVAEGRKILLARALDVPLIWTHFCFLDSDVVIRDDRWLDKLLAALEPENVGLVGPFGSFVAPDWTRFIPGVPGPVDCVAGACQLFKREVLGAGVGIDTSYEGFWTEDSQFCLDIRNAGYDVLCVPIDIEHHPAHSGFGQIEGLHDKHFAMFRERWQGKGLVKAERGY